jgi:steroid delta-isomerase-like uncharacterized protein
MSMANKELSRRFTELFSTGDEAVAERVLAPDLVFTGREATANCTASMPFKGFLSAYRRAFPDARSTVEDQVAEGDTVATRWHARGTHLGALGPVSATNRAWEMDGVTIERIAGGRIAEVWVARDELGLLGSLGLVSTPQPDAVAAHG